MSAALQCAGDDVNFFELKEHLPEAGNTKGVHSGLSGYVRLVGLNGESTSQCTGLTHFARHTPGKPGKAARLQSAAPARFVASSGHLRLDSLDPSCCGFLDLQ